MQIFAITSDEIFQPINPPGMIINNADSWSVIRILSYGEEFLLMVVLPLVVVGTALYVAYELLTAEGDETKMKKAWKSISYSAIGLLVVALAYTVITLISNITF